MLDFAISRKEALIATASWALSTVSGDSRRDCLDTAIRRTGTLLLTIDAASAFGTVATTIFSVSAFLPVKAGMVGVVSLFALTVIFKLAQESSMATFAAIAPVAASIVTGTNLPPAVAVFAICFGSLIAILPNDSYYWIVRRAALPEIAESRSMIMLAGGATAQRIAGLTLNKDLVRDEILLIARASEGCKF